jgi:isopentenyldiphosphate isomerase
MPDSENIVAIFPFYRGRLMLGKRNDEPFIGEYTPITGHVEKHESIKDCLVRELYEELYSRKINPIEIEATYNKFNFKKIGKVDYDKNKIKCKISLYKCNIPNIHFTLSDEIIDMKYIDQIDPKEVNEDTRNMLSWMFAIKIKKF